MNCAKVRAQIINGLLDEADVSNQADIREHLNKCPACVGLSRKFKLLDHYLKQTITGHSIPLSHAATVTARVYEQIQSRQFRSRNYWVYQAMAAAAVFLIGVVFYFLFIPSTNRVLEGTLYVERGGETIITKRALPIGQVLKTKEGQSARIKLRDGSVLEMMPGTVLTLKSDHLLNLEEGELNCQVAKGGGFGINMPGAELKTLGTGFNIRMSTNRKEIITAQGNPLFFITSATVKVAVSSGKILLTTEQDNRRLHQEIGAGETAIREIDPPLPVELQTEIKDLIQRLGDENQAIRTKVFDTLLKIGYVILPFLQEISLPDNSPIRAQVNRLLARFPRPEILWSHEIPQVSFALQTPVVSGDQLYIVSESGLYAMDYLTGEVNWKFQQEGFNSAPLVSEGVIYIGTLSGNLFAIESKKGEILWQQSGLGVIQSTPTMVVDTIYFGSSEPHTNFGRVYALDAATGKIKWTLRTQGIITTSQVVSHQDVVLIGGWDNKLYALNARTGGIIWDYETNGKLVTSPVIADDLVYFGSWDGSFYALSILTGKKQWSFQADSEILESPVRADNTIYWGTKHKIYAFDLERRTVIWTYNRERSNIGIFKLLAGKVYLGTDSGKVIMLNVLTGEKEGDFEIPYENKSGHLIYYHLMGCPVIFNDILYITSRLVYSGLANDRVYALKLK